MTWLAIGGLVCVGVVVLLVIAVVALFVYAARDDAAIQKRVRENGKPVLAVLVMANSQLMEEDGIDSAPGVVLFSFDHPSESLADDMREAASEIYELYTSEESQLAGLPAYQQNMAKLIKDHYYKDSRRNRVPQEMTHGQVFYMADIWIERDRIPMHAAFTRALACMVTGQDEGEIIVLSPEEDAAKRIYAALAED
ncbi:hypothetical protein GC197_13710 [bacterium]|nr:hypothetical protein [bacterium]